MENGKNKQERILIGKELTIRKIDIVLQAENLHEETRGKGKQRRKKKKKDYDSQKGFFFTCTDYHFLGSITRANCLDVDNKTFPSSDQISPSAWSIPF